MDRVLPVIHLGQAAGSAYTLYFCYVSIKNLQQYEKKSEKAAEYSSTAAEQLHKTRTTQGSALVTVTLSITLTPSVSSPQLTPSGRHLPRHLRLPPLHLSPRRRLGVPRVFALACTRYQCR